MTLQQRARSRRPPSRSPVRRWWVAVALAALAPVGLACGLGDIWAAGCGSHGTEDVDTEDVLGTWTGADAGTITLDADGTFDAVDLRELDGERTRLVSGHGTWYLNQTSSTNTTRTPRVSDIHLTFIHSDGTRTSWNKIDISQSYRPVHVMQYLYGEPASCDLRVLKRELASATPETEPPR